MSSSAGAAAGSAGPRCSPMCSRRSTPPGETNYAARRDSRRSSATRSYVRPGLGLAVHTGSAGNFQRTDKIAFGSRILFEPELGIGVRINDRVSVEASWVHMSHAQLFGRQNPGIDNVGMR